MTDNFNKKDTYKITRILHPVEALFEYFISILCSGAFFAKLTMTVGISDSLTAILGSLTSLATGIQIFSIYMAKKTPVKRWVIPMQTIANLGFAAIYILPLLKLSTDTNQVLFFVIILGVRFALSLLAPCKSIWYENVIDDDKRGAHSAVVCIVSYAGSIIFTYAASAMLEYYESVGDLSTAFIIITVAILVLNVLLMISMLLCKEKPSEMAFSESTVKSLKTLFSRKTFRSFLLSHIFCFYVYALL